MSSDMWQKTFIANRPLKADHIKEAIENLGIKTAGTVATPQGWNVYVKTSEGVHALIYVEPSANTLRFRGSFLSETVAEKIIVSILNKLARLYYVLKEQTS